MPRVRLLTREGCHLCDDARDVVAFVCESYRVSWQDVDVDSDPLLRVEYSDHVPVVLVDGEVLSYWFVDADRLRAALESLP